MLFPLLLDIPYNKEEGTNNLIRIIDDDADYAAKYDASFVCPTCLAAYDSTI